MKKVLFILAIVFATANVYAQKGNKALGLQLGYGSEIKSVAIGVVTQYGISDAIDLVPSFNYFFEKDYLSLTELNVDFHYNFLLDDGFRVYPLAGLAYTTWKVDFMGLTDSESYLGINLGVGAVCDLSSKVGLGLDIKYQLLTGDGSELSQVVPMFKCIYRL